MVLKKTKSNKSNTTKAHIHKQTITQNNPRKLNLTQINCNTQYTTEKLNLTNKQQLGLFICVCIALRTI